MIILGIDPGYDRCGFGLIEKIENGGSILGVKVLDYGVITTQRSDIFQDRLCSLAFDLSELLNKYTPSVLAIEKIFWGANVDNAIKVAEARGVIEMICRKFGCKIIEYAPTQVKSQLVGHGHAEKFQLQNILKMRLGLSEIPTPDDAADALGIALLAGEDLDRVF